MATHCVQWSNTWMLQCAAKLNFCSLKGWPYQEEYQKSYLCGVSIVFPLSAWRDALWANILPLKRNELHFLENKIYHYSPVVAINCTQICHIHDSQYTFKFYLKKKHNNNTENKQNSLPRRGIGEHYVLSTRYYKSNHTGNLRCNCPWALSNLIIVLWKN